MFLPLDDYEKGKLILLAQDRTAIGGLKKMFLKSFLKKREGDIHIKAASGYAVDYMEEAFNELENMVEREKDKEERKNIV